MLWLTTCAAAIALFPLVLTCEAMSRCAVSSLKSFTPGTDSSRRPPRAMSRLITVMVVVTSSALSAQMAVGSPASGRAASSTGVTAAAVPERARVVAHPLAAVAPPRLERWSAFSRQVGSVGGKTTLTASAKPLFRQPPAGWVPLSGGLSRGGGAWPWLVRGAEYPVAFGATAGPAVRVNFGAKAVTMGLVGASSAPASSSFSFFQAHPSATRCCGGRGCGCRAAPSQQCRLALPFTVPTCRRSRSLGCRQGGTRLRHVVGEARPHFLCQAQLRPARTAVRESRSGCPAASQDLPGLPCARIGSRHCVNAVPSFVTPSTTAPRTMTFWPPTTICCPNVPLAGVSSLRPPKIGRRWEGPRTRDRMASSSRRIDMKTFGQASASSSRRRPPVAARDDRGSVLAVGSRMPFPIATR